MIAASSNSFGIPRKKFISRITFQIGSAPPGRTSAQRLLRQPQVADYHPPGDQPTVEKHGDQHDPHENRAPF